MTPQPIETIFSAFSAFLYIFIFVICTYLILSPIFIVRSLRRLEKEAAQIRKQNADHHRQLLHAIARCELVPDEPPATPAPYAPKKIRI